jgi:hypothetical protein
MDLGPFDNIVLVFDYQHNHLDQHCLTLSLVIVQRMQHRLERRQSGYRDDQHLKKDIKRLIDLKQHARSKT